MKEVTENFLFVTEEDGVGGFWLREAQEDFLGVTEVELVKFEVLDGGAKGGEKGLEVFF